MWSPAAATAITDPGDARLDAVEARMEHARCRLAQRGIGSSPLGIAGQYGFCWSPAWLPAPPPPPAITDLVDITTGGLASVILVCLMLGAGAVLGWVHRATVRDIVMMGRSAMAYQPVEVGEDADAEAKDASDLATPLSKEGATEAPGGDAAAPAAPAAAVPPVSDNTGGAGEGRFVALDQLRGLTMWAMLFVNLNYGRDGPLPRFFSHGITYVSGPDLVEPLFHFCVGYAMRLSLPRRLAAAERDGATTWLASRLHVFRHLLTTRVAGLILLSMFLTEGWGQFDSWAGLAGFGDWLGQLLRNVQPYHTLLHIALLTVWIYVPMTMGWRARAYCLLATALLHCLMLATFYFRWVGVYGLDEGGYFGFLGWAIEALVGALAYDVVLWARTPPAAPEDAIGGADGTPLLAAAGDDVVQRARAPSVASKRSYGAAEGAPLLAAEDGGSQGHEELVAAAAAKRAALLRASTWIAGGGLALMFGAYVLSCLAAYPSFNPVCYDGTRIYFWGGFGKVVSCTRVPSYGSGLFVATPFYVPDDATNAVSMWTMTQRAGSTTYHIFCAGTSALLLAAAIVACEVGVAVPQWWVGEVSARGASVGGVHITADAGGGQWLRTRWHVLEMLGENALAVYIIGGNVCDQVGNMLPPDCPAWYFLFWGEGLAIGVTLLFTSYLRSHKLILRL